MGWTVKLPSICAAFVASFFAASAVASESPAPVSSAETLDAYKKEVARLIYKMSAKHIFAEPARPLLKAVIVVSISIAPDGTARASVIRGNGFPELEDLAMESVKRATPLPRWKGARDGEVIAYMETWLFRHDDRFQIRSIAPLQATE